MAGTGDSCQERRAGKGIWAEGQLVWRLRDRRKPCVCGVEGGSLHGGGGLLPRDHIARAQEGGSGVWGWRPGGRSGGCGVQVRGPVAVSGLVFPRTTLAVSRRQGAAWQGGPERSRCRVVQVVGFRGGICQRLIGARTDRIQCPFQWMRATGNMVRRRPWWRGVARPLSDPDTPDEDMQTSLLQPHCLADKTVHMTMT